MADQNKPKSKSAKKPVGVVFDVRRPGKAPAPPTSRPIITGHKPEAQAAQTAISGVGETSPILTRRKLQILPTGDLSVEPNPAGNEAVPAEQAAEQTAAPRDVPERDKEALATAAMDAVTGPPDLSEPAEKPEAESGAEKEDRSMLFTKPKIVIAPPSEEQAPDEAEPEPKEPAPEEEPAHAEEDTAGTDSETTAETSEEKSDAATEQPAEGEEQPEPAEPAEAAVPTAEAQDTAAEGEGEEQKEEQEQKPEPHIEPLFDEHGAMVPHRSHHRRGHGLKVFALVLVILILAAAILDILLDLEVLNLEGIPHTDFL